MDLSGLYVRLRETVGFIPCDRVFRMFSMVPLLTELHKIVTGDLSALFTRPITLTLPYMSIFTEVFPICASYFQYH